jgi:hypothetical protein
MMLPAKGSIRWSPYIVPVAAMTAILGCSGVRHSTPTALPRSHPQRGEFSERIEAPRANEEGGVALELEDPALYGHLQLAKARCERGEFNAARTDLEEFIRRAEDVREKTMVMRYAAECAEKAAGATNNEDARHQLELSAYWGYEVLLQTAGQGRVLQAKHALNARQAMNRLFARVTIEPAHGDWQGASPWVDDRAADTSHFDRKLLVKHGQHALKLVLGPTLLGCVRVQIKEGDADLPVHVRGALDCVPDATVKHCTGVEPELKASSTSVQQWEEVRLDWKGGTDDLLERACTKVERLRPADDQCSAEAFFLRGRCLERRSHPEAAYRVYRDGVHRGAGGPQMGDLYQAGKRLEDKLAWIAIYLDQPSQTSLIVKIDEDLLNTYDLRFPIGVVPGVHRVRVTAPDGATWGANVNLTEPGELRLVHAGMKNVVPGWATGLTVAGGSLLTAATATVIWGSIAACTNHDALSGLCTGVDATAEADRANKRRLTGWIVGGVTGAAGVVLLGVGLNGIAHADSPSLPRATLVVGPGRVGMQGSF